MSARKAKLTTSPGREGRPKGNDALLRAYLNLVVPGGDARPFHFCSPFE